MRRRIARYLSSPWALAGIAIAVTAAAAAVGLAWPTDVVVEMTAFGVAAAVTVVLMLTGVVYQLCIRRRLQASATFALGVVVMMVLVVTSVLCSAYNETHRPWVWRQTTVSLPEGLGSLTMYSRPPSPPSWFPSQDNSPEWVLVVTRPSGQYTRLDLGQRGEITTKDLELDLIRRGTKRYLRLVDGEARDDLDLQTGKEMGQQRGVAERLGSFEGPLSFIPWHEKPAASGGLHWPCAIAVDRAGMVYVVDAGSDRLIKYSPEGRYLAQWPVGEFHTIYDVAVDNLGHVWLNSWNASLRKYTTDGHPLGTFDSFPDATGVGCGVDGTVYVTQRTEIINVVGQDGRVRVTWGRKQDRAIRFCGVAGASDGSVIIARWDSDQLWRYSAQGQLQKKWSVGGGPTDVAIDEQDNVYAALWSGKTIKVAKFSLAGRRLRQWDTPVSGDQSARRLAAHGGVVYLADRDGHRILRYTADGRPLPDFGAGE